MEEYEKYLADRLLSEEQAVTYRLLSRALDVHVNTAKEMLFNFHQSQNAAKKSSIYATYLVNGHRTSHEPMQRDGDEGMASSPPEAETLTEAVKTMTVSLVREENLQETLLGYESVSSLHVYSLSPSRHQDMSVLSATSQGFDDYRKKEAAGLAARTHGTISNKEVRRRTRKGTVATQKVTAMKPVPSPQSPVVKGEIPSTTTTSKLKKEDSSFKSVALPNSTRKAPPALNKQSSGGIMQSFAKASTKAPNVKQQIKKQDSNEAMALSDDGEPDDSDLLSTRNGSTREDAARKSRREREDELRRMMDESEDDEEEEEKEEEDKDEELGAEPNDADAEMAETEPEPEKAHGTSQTAKEAEPDEIVEATGSGRKRGRRRVMKKRRVQDDEGYMVTIQEQAWESFSEDDIPVSERANASNVKTGSSGTAKPAKQVSKAGQGSIMSFFQKK